MAADFDLSGRVAIITGGNGGIGLGMARALARAGCTVSIWGRNARKNGEALAELSGFGAPVEARECDVTDRAAIEQAFAATLSAFGRVDGCFANAGVGGGGRLAFVDRAEEDWRRMFATNLDGVFHVFQVVLRHMINRANNGDRFGDRPWSWRCRLVSDQSNRAAARASAPRSREQETTMNETLALSPRILRPSDADPRSISNARGSGSASGSAPRLHGGAAPHRRQRRKDDQRRYSFPLRS
jgi:NAD(P)-dependent dehydrogenase (short-subunit alcohol dehydrogenase family)